MTSGYAGFGRESWGYDAKPYVQTGSRAHGAAKRPVEVGGWLWGWELELGVG